VTNLIERILRLFPYVRELESQVTKALLGDIDILSLAMKDGMLDVTASTKIAPILAQWGFESLEELGAENYAEIKILHEPTGKFLAITIQRCGHKTPNEFRYELEAEVKHLKDKLASHDVNQDEPKLSSTVCTMPDWA
jgi:hypothetical protein